MSPALKELIAISPYLVVILISAYASARITRAAGLYLDGGRRGWLALSCFLVGFTLFLGIGSVILWIMGGLPTGIGAEV